MRIVYAGTPAVAVPALDALAASEHELVGVVTRPDAPLGRRRVLTPSPVALRAEELGLPVIRARRLGEEETARVAALAPDVGVIVAYGALVREPLLSTPPHGWLNVHFSLLPRWRGAAPVQHALIAGDRRTGASVFRLVAELDAGDVLATLPLDVSYDQTAGDVLADLAAASAPLVVDVVDALADGTARSVPQRGEATAAPRLVRDDGRLDPADTARRMLDRARGTTPEPGAFLELEGGPLKVLAARPAPDAAVDAASLAAGRIAEVDGRVLVGASDGALELVEVQPAGRRAMSARDWWRGLAEPPVVRTSSPSPSMTPSAAPPTPGREAT